MPSRTPFIHWLTLSDDYTILAASDNAPATVSLCVGRNLWESFPGAEEVFKPTYEEAWENGAASAVHRYAGNIVSIHVTLQHNYLLVSAQAVTIAGLLELAESLNLEIATGPQSHNHHHCPPVLRLASG
jgi:hypothetical protein